VLGERVITTRSAQTAEIKRRAKTFWSPNLGHSSVYEQQCLLETECFKNKHHLSRKNGRLNKEK
jgi:hypothetical protein